MGFDTPGLTQVDADGQFTRPADVVSADSASVSFGDSQTLADGAAHRVIIQVTAETDGTDDGDISVEVLEQTGGLTQWEVDLAIADSTLPAGTQVTESIAFLFGPETIYTINNNSDPNSNNTIDEVREASIEP